MILDLALPLFALERKPRASGDDPTSSVKVEIAKA